MLSIKEAYQKEFLKHIEKLPEGDRIIAINTFNNAMDAVVKRIHSNHQWIVNHFLDCYECFSLLGKERGVKRIFAERLLKDKLVAEQLRMTPISIDELTSFTPDFKRGYNMAIQNYNKTVDVFIKRSIVKNKKPSLLSIIKARYFTKP